MLVAVIPGIGFVCATICYFIWMEDDKNEERAKIVEAEKNLAGGELDHNAKIPKKQENIQKTPEKTKPKRLSRFSRQLTSIPEEGPSKDSKSAPETKKCMSDWRFGLFFWCHMLTAITLCEFILQAMVNSHLINQQFFKISASESATIMAIVPILCLSITLAMSSYIKLKGNKVRLLILSSVLGILSFSLIFILPKQPWVVWIVWTLFGCSYGLQMSSFSPCTSLTVERHLVPNANFLEASFFSFITFILSFVFGIINNGSETGTRAIILINLILVALGLVSTILTLIMSRNRGGILDMSDEERREFEDRKLAFELRDLEREKQKGLEKELQQENGDVVFVKAERNSP